MHSSQADHSSYKQRCGRWRVLFSEASSWVATPLQRQLHGEQPQANRGGEVQCLRRIRPLSARRLVYVAAIVCNLWFPRFHIRADAPCAVQGGRRQQVSLLRPGKGSRPKSSHATTRRSRAQLPARPATRGALPQHANPDATPLLARPTTRRGVPKLLRPKTRRGVDSEAQLADPSSSGPSVSPASRPSLDVQTHMQPLGATKASGQADVLSFENAPGDGVSAVTSPIVRPGSRGYQQSRGSTASTDDLRRYPFNHAAHKQMDTFPSPLQTPQRRRGRKSMSDLASPGGAVAFGATMGKLGSPVARDPASLHFLPDCSEAVDPVTKSAVINEWLRSYQQENNAFASVSVKTQAKLRRAAVFGERMASPNKLQTAVAFEVLEELTALFGRYKDVASEALSVLRSAVYVDPSATDGPVFMNNGQLESSSVAPNVRTVVGETGPTSQDDER